MTQRVPTLPDADVTRDEDLLRPPPEPARRRWINLAIAVWLVLQLLIPLRFYTAPNAIEDQVDERFSWRFFSTTSLQRRQTTVTETLDESITSSEPLIPLKALLALGNIKKHLGTGHPDIVERFLRWRCDHPAVHEVRYERSSARPDGSPLPTVQMVIDSATRQVRTVRGPPP